MQDEKGNNSMQSGIMKLNFKKTLLIGLGFFTVAVVWSLYNVAVPTYLDNIFSGLKVNKFLVGIIMAIDNVFAMAFNPLFGNMSDKTRTRFGRRMPYLMIGIPIAAVFFFLIPFVRESLWMLMAVVILMNLFMCMYRAPTVALMPDLTPPKFRSQANGIINLMGGIGTATAMLLGTILFAKGEALPFGVGAILMIATIIVMYIFVKEPKEAYKDKVDVVEDVQEKVLTKAEKRSIILILTAIFFWFVGYNGIETYLSIYCQNVLGLGKDVASSFFLTVSGTFLLCAIPSGYLANKIGRKTTILIGLVGMVIMSLSLLFISSIAVVYVMMAIAGVGWAMININSYPMVVQMAGGKVGRYTGYYYFFSMAAAVFSPIVLGGLMDIITVQNINLPIMPEEIIFPIAFLSFIVAIVCISMVSKGHGEADSQPQGILEMMDNED